MNFLHVCTNGQISQRGLLQVLMPLIVRFSLFGGVSGILALISLSFRFVALLKSTIGGAGKTFLGRGLGS